MDLSSPDILTLGADCGSELLHMTDLSRPLEGGWRGDRSCAMPCQRFDDPADLFVDQMRGNQGCQEVSSQVECV